MNFLKRLPYILFPARCCVCDKVIMPGEDICAACDELTLHYPVKGDCCRICGIEQTKCTCGKRLLYSKIAFPFFYENDVKHALHRFKFRGRPELAVPYAKRMFISLAERQISGGIDVITFIPMRKKAKFDRGYNQAELLANEIGRLSGIPVMSLLCKKQDTAKQHSLGARRRTGSVLGIFEPLPGRLEEIKGKNILVVDDIVTTGSTLNEAAKTLLIFGAERIYASAAAQRKRVQSAQKKPG